MNIRSRRNPDLTGKRRTAPGLGGMITLLCATLLAGLPAQAQEAPKAVRIAVVSYSTDGKTDYAGSSGVISSDHWLEDQLKSRGIALQWVPMSTAAVGTLVNESFSNNTIDFAAYGDLPSVIVNAAGVSTRLLVPGGAGSNTYLVVPANSSAASIKDLKGKRIALNRGRPWEIPFARLIAANGLQFSDFKIYNLNPQAGSAAVAAGNVDALFTLDDAYLLQDKGVGKIIWSSKEAPVDWKMRTELWGAVGFVDKYPDITQLVATAYLRASYWISQESNRDAYFSALAKSGLPESVIRREYEREQLPWKDEWSPLFSESLTRHYRDVISYSREAKLIRGDVTPETLFAPQFVTAGLKELKLGDYWTAGSAAQSAGVK